MSPSRSPTFAEVLNTLRESVFRDLRVCCTGRVTAYNSAAHEIDVQPLPAERFVGADGQETETPLKVIQGVPFANLEAGGCHVRLTPAVGDYVTLVFADRSLDGVLSDGRTESAPLNGRMHHLSDAIAYPLLVGGARPSGLPQGVVSLGANTGSDDFVALAAKVLDELTKIINAFNTHVHPVSGAATTTPTVPMLSANSVASASVSVRG